MQIDGVVRRTGAVVRPPTYPDSSWPKKSRESPTVSSKTTVRFILARGSQPGVFSANHSGAGSPLLIAVVGEMASLPRFEVKFLLPQTELYIINF